MSNSTGLHRCVYIKLYDNMKQTVMCVRMIELSSELVVVYKRFRKIMATPTFECLAPFKYIFSITSCRP